MRLLDGLFFWLRASPFFYRLTLFSRIMLAAGFIPTGAVKLAGQRFTLMSPETPIGAFFEAMYQTGLYWQFLGLSQVIAGLLLLFPRTAHLGAVLFLPIMVNILVITVSLGFTGTPFIAGAMVLCVLYLCLWDFHRFRGMLTQAPLEGTVAEHRLDRWEFAGFLVFAFCLMNFFGVTRSFIPSSAAVYFLVSGFLAGLLTLGRFVWLQRHQAFAAKRTVRGGDGRA